jgi:hypothetical protein
VLPGSKPLLIVHHARLILGTRDVVVLWIAFKTVIEGFIADMAER